MDVPNSPGILPFGVTPEGETVFQITLKNDTLFRLSPPLSYGLARNMTTAPSSGFPAGEETK